MRNNLTLIIVESLNAWVINRTIDGHEVTPTLNALIQEEGTVSALNVVTQVLDGVSSDGQFIYNTGMLPSTEVTTVYTYDKNTYVSLARLLHEKFSFEAICESGALWGHYDTTIAYGYDMLIDKIQYKIPNKGKDEALFTQAIEVIDTISKPFFAQLTTLSMHTPFIDEAVKCPKWIEQAKGLTEPMRNYLSVTHFFDLQLGRFIDHLKQRGIYDDTLIVIASDHSIPVEGASNEENNSQHIVFIAANTPVTRQINQVVGQIDVFPTILDLMGTDTTSYSWRGLGLSMLNPRCNGAIDKEGKLRGEGVSEEYATHLQKAHSVCNTMLRMDYFKKYSNAKNILP